MREMRRRGALTHRLLALLVVASGLGCSRPATQLVVVVDTDLPRASYGCFGLLVSRVGEGGALSGASRRFLDADEVRVPFSFGVHAAADRPRVEVAVEALPRCEDPLPGQRVVRRAVRTGFLEGQTLELSLFLPAACGEGCEVTETCPATGPTCAPIPTVEPTELVPITPGQELAERDASVPDASVPDASTLDAPDAALDAGRGTALPPRPIAPLSTSRTTSRRPTLRFELAGGTDGARVEVCRDRACTDPIEVIETSGTSAQPTSDLEPGVVYWRLFGRSGGLFGVDAGPTWQLHIGARPAPIDTSWGTTLDLDGDGLADVAIGAPGEAAADGRVYVFYGDGESVLLEAPGAGEAFGRSVASAGDVDGDGFADLVVGANAADASAGRVYVFGGSALGVSTLASRILDAPDGGSGNFGWSVASAGDVDGDGFGDVIVGAHRAMGDEGRAYVYRGGASGLELAPSTTLVARDGAPGYFGASVAGAGDLDGDGLADVIVGAYGVSSDAGAAYVYLGRDLASATPIALPSVDGAGTFFGEAVACAGDLNGDGHADLAVGASATASATGRVFVFYGGVGGVSPAPSVTLTGPDGTDVQFGASVDGAGDVDRDGYADLVVGAPRFMSAAGRAYVFHGSATGIVSSARTTLTGVDGANAELGRSVSGLGDLDGDGFDDVGVGAPNVAMLTGRAYSYRGSAIGVMESTRVTYSPSGGTGSELGYSVASARDAVRGPASGASGAVAEGTSSAREIPSPRSGASRCASHVQSSAAGAK
jgi:hypothetical protein